VQESEVALLAPSNNNAQRAPDGFKFRVVDTDSRIGIGVLLPAAKKRTRTHQRANIILKTELESGATRTATGTTANVSMRGIFFRPDRWMPVGTDCRVTIALAGPPNAIHIHAQGRIVWSDGSGIGVEFVDIDTESFGHLKQLVQSVTDSETSDSDVLDEPRRKITS
jgi:PilZ domain